MSDIPFHQIFKDKDMGDNLSNYEIIEEWEKENQEFWIDMAGSPFLWMANRSGGSHNAFTFVDQEKQSP